MLTLSVKINTGYTRDQSPTHLGTRDQCPHSTRAYTALIEQACPCSTPGVTSLLCPGMSLDSITPYRVTKLITHADTPNTEILTVQEDECRNQRINIKLGKI